MKDISPVAWPIIGQEAVLHYLHKFLLQERWSAGLLFHGPAHIGKTTCARLLLQTMLCHQRNRGLYCGHCTACMAWQKGQHPDFHHVVADDAGSIGITEIRVLQRHLHLQPSLGEYRTALIEQADRLTPEAANALLKTLEEPLQQTVIVLTADVLGMLPITLRSRMQTIALEPVSQKVLYHVVRQRTEDEELALHMSCAADGMPGIALTFLDDQETYAAYCADARLCLTVMQANIPQRWALARAAWGTAVNPELARRRLGEVIEVWSRVVRDLLLIREQCQEFLIHRFMMAELSPMAERYSSMQLVHLLRRLADVRTGISRYLNPQLLLEHYLLYV